MAHRGEAAASKEQAGEVKQDVQEARAEPGIAVRDGWRLAEAIRARRGCGPAGTDGGNEDVPAGEPPIAERGLASLKSLADTLFPPR